MWAEHTAQGKVTRGGTSDGLGPVVQSTYNHILFNDIFQQMNMNKFEFYLAPEPFSLSLPHIELFKNFSDHDIMPLRL